MKPIVGNKVPLFIRICLLGRHFISSFVNRWDTEKSPFICITMVVLLFIPYCGGTDNISSRSLSPACGWAMWETLFCSGSDRIIQSLSSRAIQSPILLFLSVGGVRVFIVTVTLTLPANPFYKDLECWILGVIHGSLGETLKDHATLIYIGL